MNEQQCLLIVAGWVKRYGGEIHDHCIIVSRSEFNRSIVVFSEGDFLRDASDFVMLQVGYDYNKMCPAK